MKIPVIKGIIDRRMLVNFTVELDVARAIVPAPFTPKAFKGKAIAGICLIRLKHIRPKGLPALMGLGSENGAHRIAVEWMENGNIREGVYIPRRDTSSVFNALVGGRVFPGRHYHAHFDVKEQAGQYHVAFKSSDATMITVDAKLVQSLGANSIFKDLQEASVFFKAGATGYSPNGKKYDGLHLNTYTWEMKPLEVSSVHSSFFENETIFPKGSVKFDNALLMTNIEHEWWSVADKLCY
ncbi:DUF2071 domain-containing protein [Mucilaginibacter sp. CSA2-8R]|uniref:DUF2071 domain-containing protein n=1 Tax=Mucilaginibacter sp. CSA2-8R TaxID=3141542 RepID=UPI00315DCB3A